MIEVRAVQPTGEELRAQFGEASFGDLVELVYRLIGPFGLLALFIFGVRFAEGDSEWVLIGVVIATYGLTGLAGGWLRWTYVRAVKRSPLANEPVDWTLSADAIGLSTPTMSSRLGWAAVTEIREGRRRFEFRAPPGSDLILPKRSLTPEQIEALRDLIGRLQADGWDGSVKLSG